MSMGEKHAGDSWQTFHPFSPCHSSWPLCLAAWQWWPELLQFWRLYSSSDAGNRDAKDISADKFVDNADQTSLGCVSSMLSSHLHIVKS